MNIDESYYLTQIVPRIDRAFKASKYIGVFDIVSLRIEYEFDVEMNYVHIRQSITGRKALSGPNGWCAPVNMVSQQYYLYKNGEGKIIQSELIEDDAQHYYMVVDFRQNLRVDDVVQFSTETKQSLESPILGSATRRTKTLFFSRLYGASCENCEVAITIPYTYKLIKSIPKLTGKGSVYKYKTRVRKLEPIYLSVIVRRRFLPFLSRIFCRDAHPLVWVVISAILSLLFVIIWTFIKMKGEN